MKYLGHALLGILSVFACVSSEATQRLSYDITMFFECARNTDTEIEEFMVSFAKDNGLNSSGNIHRAPWEIVMLDTNIIIHVAKILAAPATYVASIVSRPSTRGRSDIVSGIRSNMSNMNGCKLYLEKNSQNDASKEALFDEFLRYYRSLR